MIIIHTMNDNHSQSELHYKSRWIASLLMDAVKEHPVVVLTGARQVGKSTLLQHESPFKDWQYSSLDDFEILELARKDPQSIWAGTNQIVLDEVQKSTNILNAVKMAVDSHKGKYRFLLSGSANLILMKQVSESLAGRAVYFTLYPMTYGELTDSSPPNTLQLLFDGNFQNFAIKNLPVVNPYDLMWKGFLPPLMYFSSSTSVVRWWDGYISTYLERDLRQLSQIDSLADFRRLMVALALRCGQVLNQTEVSRDIGISQPTIHRYINLLETTCLIDRLPAFFVNRTKRLIKSNKIIFVDPGLASFLAGHYETKSLVSSRVAGGIFESMIYLHLKSLSQQLTPTPRIYYWRTVTGKEVDFVIEWGRRLLAIEVKLTDKPKYSDIENLKIFLKEYPETTAGILFYTGSEIKRMHEKIIALPWALLN
jgi:uncharacterized protein